jgi:hypothetical protein
MNILFYFILFQIIPNLYECMLNLFEDMHTAARLHTAALPDSRTLPHTAGQPHTAVSTATHYRAHCRTRAGALPHTSACTAADIRAHCRTLPHYRILPHYRTVAHCRAHCHTLLRTPRTLHESKCRTPHTAHLTHSHTTIIMNSNDYV